MSFKQKCDKQLKEHLCRFFELAAETVCITPEEAADAFNSALKGEGGRMFNSVVFAPNAERENLHSQIVARCVKLLGSKAGDDIEVSNNLWKTSTDTLQSEPKSDDAVVAFFARMDELAAVSLSYLAPNHLVRLVEEVDRLDIGPVRVLTGAVAASHLNTGNDNPRWTAVVGVPGTTFSGEKITVGVANPCWLIEARASKGNIAEEASWLSSVAISLLRLTAYDTLDGRFPDYGDVEPHPFQAAAPDNEHIILDGKMLSTGGKACRYIYTVTPRTLERCDSQPFRTIAESIFNPPTKSVAERVAQGLGWLARGRQAKDRAERFLNFFTAVEALLSMEDKTAPVIQTIARHAACILSDTPDARHKTAKLLRDLYVARSALVHAGARNVTSMEMRAIHMIAESLFLNVLHKVELNDSLQDFHAELQTSSYGSLWREGAADRLSTTT
jgi:hypothetical protein